MEDAYLQIGARLHGLREVLEIPVEEIAKLCGITPAEYLRMEKGEADNMESCLALISKRYGVELDVLLFGEEPRMKGYLVTRHGQGLAIDRCAKYKYQSLASGFRQRLMDPFLVEVAPLPEGERRVQRAHPGQEFDVVVEGRLELTIGQRTIVLGVGDSIYLDSSRPHSMHALDGRPVKFLCVTVNP